MPDNDSPAGATPAVSGATPDQKPAAPTAAPPPTPPAKGDAGDDALGEGGKRALEAERNARRDADSRAKTAEDELKKLRDASLSDSEKRDQRLSELERREQDWARERQDLILANDTERLASRLGFAYPEDVLNLLRRSEIEFEADGTPKNLEKLLRDLLKAKPLLAGNRPAGSGDLGAGGAGPGGLTREQIKGMSPAEINARWGEVQAAMSGKG